MLNTQDETKQPVNTTQMEALHQKHIALAKVAEGKGDQVLSESHYQRAEYYLHALSERGGPTPVATVAAATARPLVRASQATKRVIKDFNLKRTDRKYPSDTRGKQGNVLPFRGYYLCRNRRGIQDKEITG